MRPVRRLPALVVAAALALLLASCTASPPASLTVTPGDGQVTVAFAEDGTAIRYEVMAMPGGHSTVGLPSLRLAGLTNGTAYTISVRALGDLGWSDWTVHPTAVVPVGPPTAPTITAVTGVVDLHGCTAEVVFTAGSDGGSPVTRYEVVTSADPDAVVVGADSPIQVPALAPHTSYDFTVRAVNAKGTGPASATYTAPCS